MTLQIAKEAAAKLDRQIRACEAAITEQQAVAMTLTIQLHAVEKLVAELESEAAQPQKSA